MKKKCCSHIENVIKEKWCGSLVLRLGGNSMLSFMVININPNEIVNFNKNIIG
jgi:hypothetical protein